MALRFEVGLQCLLLSHFCTLYVTFCTVPASCNSNSVNVLHFIKSQRITCVAYKSSLKSEGFEDHSVISCIFVVVRRSNERIFPVTFVKQKRSSGQFSASLCDGWSSECRKLYGNIN
jgi:hypothetical protein